MANGIYGGESAIKRLMAIISDRFISLENKKQNRITSGVVVPSDGVEGDVYIQTGAALPIEFGGTGATNVEAVRETLDVSPKGTASANGAIVRLWSGSSQAPSFTASEALTNFKYFLVRPGSASNMYNIMIPVFYTTAAASGNFRGIYGFDSSSAGSEIYTIEGTVSENTVNITRCYYRTSKAITTNNQCYVKEVWGIR